MNNNIKQFAEQVGIDVGYLANTKQLALLEKFAELIIFESIKIAVFKGDATIGKAIQNHFEVEL